MTIDAELEAISTAWSEELVRALRERSAWAWLGTVDFPKNRGTGTLGGYIDRRGVPFVPGKSATDVLEAWRRTADGKLVDRVLAQANAMLLPRLPRPDRRESLSGPWIDAIDTGGPIVVIGSTSDLMTVARLARQSPAGARIHPCPVDAPGTALVACTGSGLSASMVSMISVARGPAEYHVVAVVDVKARPTGRLERIDIVP